MWNLATTLALFLLWTVESSNERNVLAKLVYIVSLGKLAY